MSEKGVTIEEYLNQESGAYVSVDLDVAFRDFYYKGILYGKSGMIPTGVSASGSVDIGGAIYVYSDPTALWYSIYPGINVEMEILEDRDVKFEPKETRLMKGIIKERKRGEFVTGFADELASEEDSD